MRFVSLMALLIFAGTFQVFGQKVDHVTLKNGSVIRGEIIEMIPGEQLTITDMAGNSWVFSMEEVKAVDKREIKVQSGSPGFERGWVNMTTIGFLAGSSNSMQVAPFTFQNSFGYRQGMGLYTGLLSGLEFLNINHIPVMLDIQYALKNSEVSPVLIARGGYAVPVKRSWNQHGTEMSYTGGPAGSLGIGLKIRSRDSFAWDVAVLFRHMQISYSEYFEWNDSDYKYTDIYNRLELRLGFYLD